MNTKWSTFSILCQRSSMPNKHFLLEQFRAVQSSTEPSYWNESYSYVSSKSLSGFQNAFNTDRFWDLVFFLFLTFPWILWSIELFGSICPVLCTSFYKSDSHWNESCSRSPLLPLLPFLSSPSMWENEMEEQKKPKPWI